jgi:hypothetical protein
MNSADHLIDAMTQFVEVVAILGFTALGICGAVMLFALLTSPRR